MPNLNPSSTADDIRSSDSGSLRQVITTPDGVGEPVKNMALDELVRRNVAEAGGADPEDLAAYEAFVKDREAEEGRRDYLKSAAREFCLCCPDDYAAAAVPQSSVAEIYFCLEKAGVLGECSVCGALRPLDDDQMCFDCFTTEVEVRYGDEEE